jgi:Zn-dependent peptidase ImmA (M78 family)
LTELVEKAGVLVVPFDFGSPLVDGLAIYEPNDTLPPMVFLDPKLSGDRWRWTLAHELGHVVLHHHLPIPPDEKDMEKEAHRFASELLLPHRDVWAHLGHLTMARLAQLKRVWRVSMRSLVIRATELKRITERQAKYLWMQISRQGGTSEPVEVEREDPRRLRDLVSKHLDDLGYSYRELSNLLHQHLDEFRSDFAVQATHLRLA